jgi:hypothetical protein
MLFRIHCAPQYWKVKLKRNFLFTHQHAVVSTCNNSYRCFKLCFLSYLLLSLVWRMITYLVNWAPRYEGVLGKWRYGSTHSWSRHQMEVSGQLHDTAALFQGKSPRYPLDRRLGGPQSCSGRGVEKKIPTSSPPWKPQISHRLTSSNNKGKGQAKYCFCLSTVSWMSNWIRSSRHSYLNVGEQLVSRYGCFTTKDRAPGTHWTGGCLAP